LIAAVTPASPEYAAEVVAAGCLDRFERVEFLAGEVLYLWHR
jgi:hypothetical protein